jgi:hypothetical protein
VLVPGAWPAHAGIEPRTVLLLADRGSPVRGLATPPLTQLGLLVEGHDTDARLPALEGRSDLRGILVWLDDGAIADERFVDWIRGAVQARLPVVLMGKLPEVEDRFGLFLALDLLYAFDDRAYTYDMRVVDWDEALVGFDRRLDPLLPPAPLIRPLDAPLAHSILVLERRSNAADRTHVLIATPKGGFAADGYAVWQSADGAEHRWVVDPVAWFRTTLQLAPMPIPDATTLNGRRIFAPSIAAAGPDDTAAALAEAVSSSRGLRLPHRTAESESAVFIPARERACSDRLRARLFGYRDSLTPLHETYAATRSSAFAPILLACRDERDLVVAAAGAAFGDARTLPLTIQRGDLEAIEQGFRAARIESLPGFAWRIHDRGALQTVRFDATEMHVDWNASEGLLGAARVFGALYVSLDPDAATPAIVLTRAPWAPPPFPVLVESRWNVFDLQRTGDRVAMTVRGDGDGAMAWSTDPRSNWEIRLAPRGGGLMRYRIRADETGLISFGLPAMAGDSGRLDLIRYYGADGS